MEHQLDVQTAGDIARCLLQMAAPTSSVAGIWKYKTGRVDKRVWWAVWAYPGIQADDKLDQPFQSHQLQQEQGSQNHEVVGNTLRYP